MTRWFGESWGAPICDLADHAPTPVGEPCADCSEPIRESGARSQGLLVPHLDADGASVRPWHLDCFLNSVGIRTPAICVRCGAEVACAEEGPHLCRECQTALISR